MDSEMTSKAPQLRVPLQAAPISRTLAGPLLATGIAKNVVPARIPIIDGGSWCERLGLPPEICQLLPGGGTTGPTSPTF